MSVDVSFSERLSHIMLLTNALALQGLPMDSARNEARKLEEEIRGKATSMTEYQEKLQQALNAFLMPIESAPEATQQPSNNEILNHQGPSYGEYRYATFHADGQSATIFKAAAKDENGPSKIVALKVTYPSIMHPPHNVEREGRLLVKARHEHVVPLLETLHLPSGRFMLVFPFLRYDLENLLRSGWLDRRRAKMVFDGLFQALEHIHGLGMIHRDVKPSNIMLASMEGPVYLIDFGITWLAEDKDCEPANAKITDVGTTCYRPPELLFGYRSYDSSLDMWAAGCIVAEMVRGGGLPLFDGGAVGSELGLIKSIFTTLGTPNNEIWPSASLYPDWGKMKFQEYPGKAWKDILPGTTSRSIDFVRTTVCYEPTRRLSASQALKHGLDRWDFAQT
ncbi:mitogen-activated protein kinase [Exophiala oligosperma]